MKLHFEPHLDYQLQAIDAVCDLFRGQELCRSEFSVMQRDALPGLASESGHGNGLLLRDDQLLANLHAVQLRHGLRPSTALTSGDFTVEMETGTGKTYVYLRTIFELNKRYGFTKFVIVVPSIAIKEGVAKSLQITADHFRSLYAGVPFHWFVYDSSRPGDVRSFATSAQIQVMVVTVGAINKKDVNNLYKPTEMTGDEKPIDLIRATRPIVIVDEPQSVDGGLEGRGKEALQAMHPLCTLRYSATHADKHHMVYRLDAVDAYERKLVKQIEVAAATLEATHNRPFVRLISVTNQRGTISAKIEIDVQTKSGVKRKELTVSDGDDLHDLTQRALYEGYRIGELSVAKGREHLELRYLGGERFLRPGEAHGDVEPMAVQRQMIRRTIKEHFEKELRFTPLGVKVLSLFFIDSVERYRSYDAEGRAIKGPYAQVFEEEYRALAKHPDYQSIAAIADEAHDGYFSIDKKGGWTDTAENNQGNRDSAERAYSLIMRDKERLLSFDTPLRFIFSHSALREGWDNPNVFQICALREMGSERERRQTIGRGLRLCVNQQGERLRGFDINTLTVIATESYEQFAQELQREIEADTGIRFGIVESHQFAGIASIGPSGSALLWQHLVNEGYVDAKGAVQDALRIALKEGSIALPDGFEASRAEIVALLRKLSGRIDIRNADERLTVKTRQAVLQSAEFKALWDRIKHRTTYRVQFDSEALITACITALREAPPIVKARLQWRKADLQIGRGGIEAIEAEGAATVLIDEGDIVLPDLLTELQDKTQLTRRSLHRILADSERLSDFARNPQQFIEIAVEVIQRAKRLALVDGIKYQRLGEGDYYAQELFETKELTGYLKSMLPATKSVHEHVIYQSETERRFAEALERNEAIKVYAKLPGWFRVPTPLGPYNPDWAVLVDRGESERLYFVVETKSSLFNDDLRAAERAKIHCGEAHFSATAEAQFIKATCLDDLLAAG